MAENNLAVAPYIILTYNSVDDMKRDTKLHPNNKCRTLGYFNPEDGGSGEYKIVKKDDVPSDIVVDGGQAILLGNQSVAILQDDSGYVNVAQYGVTSDDDSYQNPYRDQMLVTCFTNNKRVKFLKNKRYTFTQSVIFNNPCKIEELDFNFATICRNDESESEFDIFKFLSLRDTNPVGIKIHNGIFKDMTDKYIASFGFYFSFTVEDGSASYPVEFDNIFADKPIALSVSPLVCFTYPGGTEIIEDITIKNYHEQRSEIYQPFIPDIDAEKIVYTSTKRELDKFTVRNGEPPYRKAFYVLDPAIMEEYSNTYFLTHPEYSDFEIVME